MKIKEKECRIPLIQGGMGVGVSLGRLAGTVAKEGGAGIISSAQIGFREEDFASNTDAANLRAMEKEFLKAREISPDGILGFNIMSVTNRYESYVRKAVEIGADLIISGAGLPTDLPKYVEGSKTAIAPIVSTEKAANVILRYWDKKHGRTADLVIIEGPKAGGHLGFQKDQLSKLHEEDYENEIRNIIKIVRSYEEKYGHKIPVAVAGGITDAEDAKRAFALGADAVQVASRFVTTEECDADIRYKEAYLKAKQEDIVIVDSPVGMPGRAIANSFVKEVKNGHRKPVSHCFNCLKVCNPGTTPYCITQALIKAVTGDVDNGLLFCGANAWKAEKIETVKEVIDSIIKDCV